MTDGPGRLIASGRDTDVFDLGGGLVLRRFRSTGMEQRAAAEAEVMRYVASHGYPVPTVHHVDGNDMMLDHIDGVTMLEALGAKPWKLPKYAGLLAELHRRLGAIEAPDFLLADGVSTASGESVLHLDLHPANVILSPTHGPTVIDWTNAAAGPPAFDAAITFVVMSVAQIDSPRDRIGRELLVRLFARRYGRTQLERFVGAACDHRLADPNTEPAERAALAALRKRRGRNVRSGTG